MHRNRGYPPVNAALSLITAIKNQSHTREKFLRQYEAKEKKDEELKERVEDLRARWAEFKGRIEKAFLESSSDETERLAATVKEAEEILEGKLERTRLLTKGIECLLRIYCLIKKYNNDSGDLRQMILDLVEDINKYITKGQISGYYSSLANSFDLIHDSHTSYLNRMIECKKELLIEDISERDKLVSSRRVLEKEIELAKKVHSEWENNLTAVKDVGSADLYSSTHLKICLPHYIQTYSDLTVQEDPKTILEQIERINYIYLHMKAIVNELDEIKEN